MKCTLYFGFVRTRAVNIHLKEGACLLLVQGLQIKQLVEPFFPEQLANKINVAVGIRWHDWFGFNKEVTADTVDVAGRFLIRRDRWQSTTQVDDFVTVCSNDKGRQCLEEIR